MLEIRPHDLSCLGSVAPSGSAVVTLRDVVLGHLANGHLREAFVLAVHPAGQKPNSAGPRPPSEACCSVPQMTSRRSARGYPYRGGPSGTGEAHGSSTAREGAPAQARR